MTISTPTYATSFWGKNEEGVEVLMTKIRNSKQTFVDFQSMFAARSALEEEYANKLMNLAKAPFGEKEFGNLKSSLETFRSELETQANAHLTLSQKIKDELEAEILDFAKSQREKRRAQSIRMEKAARDKAMFRAQVSKIRERWETEKQRIKEMERHPHVEHNPEYHSLVSSYRQLDAQFWDVVGKSEEADAKWVNDWRESCNVFQKLEEDRIEFLKKVCWDFSNLIAANCVTEDESCENIRVSLEKCNTQADIVQFIQEHGTGDEIPESIYPRGPAFNAKPYETRSESSQNIDNSPSIRPNVDPRDPINNTPSGPPNTSTPGPEQPTTDPSNPYPYDPRNPRNFYYQNGTDPYRNYPSPYVHRNGYYPVDPRMGYYGTPAPSPMVYPGRMVDYSPIPGHPASPGTSPHQMAFYQGMPNQRSPWINYGGNGYPTPLQIDNGQSRPNSEPKQAPPTEATNVPKPKTAKVPEPTHGLGVYQASPPRSPPQPKIQQTPTAPPVQPYNEYPTNKPLAQSPQAHPRPQPREHSSDTKPVNQPQAYPSKALPQQAPQSPYYAPYPPGQSPAPAATHMSPTEAQFPYGLPKQSTQDQPLEASTQHPQNYPAGDAHRAYPDAIGYNPNSRPNSYADTSSPMTRRPDARSVTETSHQHPDDDEPLRPRHAITPEAPIREFSNMQLENEELARGRYPPHSSSTPTKQASRSNDHIAGKNGGTGSTPIKESRSVFASRSKESIIQESTKPKMSVLSDKPHIKSSTTKQSRTDSQAQSFNRPKSQVIDSRTQMMNGQHDKKPLSNSLDETSAGNTSNQNKDTLGYSAVAKQPDMEVRALYDYDAESAEELSIHEGQVIRVLATHLDGWWEGQIQLKDGSIKRGLFPSNFTEPVINLNFE